MSLYGKLDLSVPQATFTQGRGRLGDGVGKDDASLLQAQGKTGNQFILKCKRLILFLLPEVFVVYLHQILMQKQFSFTVEF